MTLTSLTTLSHLDSMSIGVPLARHRDRMSGAADSRRPRKLRRNPRACDLCNSRSVKCKASDGASSHCQNCLDYGEDCTFNRPMRKRGARPKSHRPADKQSTITVSSASPSVEISETHHQNVQPSSILGKNNASPEPSSWKPQIVPTQAIVMDLTEIYFEVVYPVFPFFHRPTLLRKISRGEYVTNRPLFASVLAMCALSSARVRDGALYTDKWDPKSLQIPSSEEFLQAATEAIPSDAPLSQEFDYMRAYALLAITSIQYGDPRQMNYYLCLYHSCIAVGMLHDESNWPTIIGHVEIEERRRLFWSTYTLDVFSSIIWGGVVKSREACFNVSYPTECDDESFSDLVFPKSGEDESAPVWLKGWNFVTDLYRFLEHTVDLLGHLRNPVKRTPPIHDFLNHSNPSRSTVLSNIMALYEQLPPIFRATQPITGNLSSDLFGFQAANIAASLQLVRMVLFTTEHSTVDQKCQIASEVINGFASVPVAYLRAISSPLFHHLAGIGTIMGSAFENGLTESSYRRVRSVLLDLANLLANLEVDLYCAAGTSDKLRVQVSRIDDFMNVQRSIDTNQSTEDLGMWRQTQDEQTFSASTLQGQLGVTEDSPEIRFPAELFENWSWAFDFN